MGVRKKGNTGAGEDQWIIAKGKKKEDGNGYRTGGGKGGGKNSAVVGKGSHREKEPRGKTMLAAEEQKEGTFFDPWCKGKKKKHFKTTKNQEGEGKRNRGDPNELYDGEKRGKGRHCPKRV